MNNTFSKEETLQKLITGVNTLANVVKTTCGSKGSTYLIRNENREPYITKDGVSIAEVITCDDPIEDLGCKLLQQAAKLTVDQAGDGTTATITIAQKMINEVIAHLDKGMTPAILLSEVESSIEKAIVLLKEEVNPVDTLDQAIAIASISANDSDLGLLVGEVVWEAKDNGIINLEEGETDETEVYQESGCRYNRPYEYKELLGVSQTKVAYNNPLVIVEEHEVQSFSQIQHHIERSASLKKPLVIIAPDWAKIVINTLIHLQQTNNLRVLPLFSPGYGEDKREYLKDIQAIVADNVDRVVADKMGFTIFTYDITPQMQERAEFIKAQIASEPTLFYKEKLEKRMSIIYQKVFTVNVGAPSRIEMKEKYDRIEDALLATRCALEEGYVLGGGVALYNVAEKLGESTSGEALVRAVLKSPLRQIISNASIATGKAISYPTKDIGGNNGFNTTTLKIEDFYKSMIIDPYPVVNQSFINATSVAKTIININGTIIPEIKVGNPKFQEGVGFTYS